MNDQYGLYINPHLGVGSSQNVTWKPYTGWPRKNRKGILPQDVDAITAISVWGNFSWEKWYQDHQFWFSSLFSSQDPKFSLFSLNYVWMNATWSSMVCRRVIITFKLWIHIAEYDLYIYRPLLNLKLITSIIIFAITHYFRYRII